jgi:hypothetical protein
MAAQGKQQVQAVNPALLVDRSFLSHTRRLLAGSHELSVGTEAFASAAERWLRRVLDRLERLIGLDLDRAKAPEQAQLRFVQLAGGGGVQGLSIPTEDGWQVQWRPTGAVGRKPTANDRHTLVHELGHTLGLGHPGGKPRDKRFDTSSTVLSYRKSSQGWNDWFSDADLAALQQAWNPEVRADRTMRWFTSRGRSTVRLDQRLEAEPEGSTLAGGGRGSQGRWGNLLIGGDGPDRLIGGSGRNWLTGGPGDDLLQGGPQADVLIGGPGADRIVLGGGADIVASCRDGAIDTIVMSARVKAGRGIPLIEALDPDDRLELTGVGKGRLSVSSAQLDGLAGVGLSLDQRLFALVADPWLSVSQVRGMLVVVS